MTVTLFHVDAFTAAPFSGNPVAAFLPPSWREDRWLQVVRIYNRTGSASHADRSFLQCSN
jgi:predicted PhzF superfamily epimerase YddE/YHI9